jgi:hypothetical protein
MVRTRRLRDLMILSRKRHLLAVMALLVRNWGTLLWTRPKGTQRHTADGEEPHGIEDRDDGNGDSALAEGSNPQSELLIAFDEIYDSEVAVVNLLFKNPTTTKDRHQANRRWRPHCA